MSTFIEWLLWVESTGLAVWVGESRYGFQLALVLHALSMGLLAGGNLVLGLRVLGVAPAVPMAALLRFYPWLWSADWSASSPVSCCCRCIQPRR